jgi:HTH-type transcriptional regulator/antitoxin HigA
MIAVVDNTKYGQLLAEILPRKIETEEQNERYLQIVETLMDKGSASFSPEEHVLFDLMVTLIEDFEEKTYPMPDILPHERIKYLLEEKRLRQKDLLPIFGSEGVISDTLNGKRQVTLKTAQKLAAFFNVPTELFI